MFDFRDVLDSDGLIARRRRGYERREAQLAMAAEVDAAIRGKHCLAVEAGTGVGKSFAYLVPAILYCVDDQVCLYSQDPSRNESFSGGDRSSSADPLAQTSNVSSESDAARSSFSPGPRLPNGAPVETEAYSVEPEPVERVANGIFDTDDLAPAQLRRVVISTHTISLQEQLFEKDIPFLNSILPFEFTAALAKGRANYVCLRRFSHASKNPQYVGGSLLEDDDKREFQRLAEWVQKTEDGSKSELGVAPPSEIWNEICCEQGNCLGRRCPWRDKCFYFRARRRLENAQLIVVNHALLFSDLAVRRENGSILPNYDVLIFDEAHTMEQVAADHLGVELTQYSIDYMLSRLYNDRTTKGLLSEEANAFAIGVTREHFVDTEKVVDDCRLRAEEFFESLSDWLDKRPGSNGRVHDKNIVPNNLVEGLSILSRKLREAAEMLEDPGRRTEYNSAKDRVDATIDALKDWLEQKSEGFVYWIERFGGERRVRIAICSAPIDVAPILRAQLFNTIPTVVAASATLTTSRRNARTKRVKIGKKIGPDRNGESNGEPLDEESLETKKAFAFFRDRVGLNGAPARALGSPFDYREQMTLVLAKGLEVGEWDASRLGLADDERKKLNEERLFSALRDYIEETDGGAFVLFTNNAVMKRATEALSSWMALKNYPFFSQAEGVPRKRMVRLFKESMNSVLFGVDSFWQGVDVPGAALRNVIIVKFPFLAPDQPLTQARTELIEANGGDGFRDYLLPNAILKFKQGVGRLIRTRDDVGQVVVLDERIHTKSYGRDFLNALPDCKLRVDTFAPPTRY